MTQSSPTWLSKVCYWTFTAWNTGVRLFVAFSLPFWAVGLMSRGQHGSNDRNPRDYLGLKIQNFLVDVPNQTKPLKAKSCIIAIYTKTKQNHVGIPTTNLRFGDGLYHPQRCGFGSMFIIGFTPFNRLKTISTLLVRLVGVAMTCKNPPKVGFCTLL